MSARPIITISATDDAHLPFVQAHLDRPLLIVDPERMLHGEELSFVYKNGKLIPVIAGQPIPQAKSVWYRKPRSLTKHLEVPVPGIFADYAKTSLTNHFAQLRVQFREALWVSDYYAIQRAENKTLQLEMASSVGLATPQTLFTSSDRAAQAFLECHRTIITKSLAGSFPANDTQAFFFFAKKITAKEKSQLTNLHLAPAIFQQAIDAVADVRVTVIGKQVFAAKITGTDQKGQTNRHAVRDWRYAHLCGKVHFEKYKLDPHTEQACSQLVQKLGLQYGAIDLVIDKERQVCFWRSTLTASGHLSSKILGNQ